MVECCDLGDPESFGRRHDRPIDSPERQISIPTHQLGDSQPITRHDALDGELAGREVTEESNLRVSTQPAPDQVCHFRDDERRDDQRTWIREQQIE